MIKNILSAIKISREVRKFPKKEHLKSLIEGDTFESFKSRSKLEKKML